MLIKVTQEHIDKGERGSSCNCPIAMAIGELTLSPVSVGGAVVCTRLVNYPLPVSARLFICEFDNGGHVKPFEFELI